MNFLWYDSSFADTLTPFTLTIKQVASSESMKRGNVYSKSLMTLGAQRVEYTGHGMVAHAKVAEFKLLRRVVKSPAVEGPGVAGTLSLKTISLPKYWTLKQLSSFSSILRKSLELSGLN